MHSLYSVTATGRNLHHEARLRFRYVITTKYATIYTQQRSASVERTATLKKDCIMY